MEKSRKGDHVISLTLEQTSWCLSTFRRLILLPVGSILDGNLVSMVIRRNSHGSFIKVEVLESDEYIFIPLGQNGFALECFFHMVH